MSLPVFRIALVSAVVLGSLAGATPNGPSQEAVYDLANTCRALHSPFVGAFVGVVDGEYRAEARAARHAEPFFMEPSGLGTYLFHDHERHYLAVEDPGAGTFDPLSVPLGVTRQDEVSAAAEWRLEAVRGGVTIVSTATGDALVARPDGTLDLADEPSLDEAVFRFVDATGCTPFPEAEVGATGEPFRGTRPDGTVIGLADAHTQVSAYHRLGGKVIHGQPFHPLGITKALADGREDHGPEGTLDVLGNLLRSGSPAGSHDTTGWPTFPEWPAYDTYTHQQSYYVWLQRMWMAGLRLMVTNAVADEQLCQLMPLRERDCDSMDAVRLQLESLRALQDYIDAQAGGPEEGFFRIVDSPEQARAVIAEGKLAVVLGIESSKLFGCGEFMDEPECTETDIDAGIEEFHGLGVRTVFPAHWFDNAYAGAGLFGQSELELNALNKLETGHYYRVTDCPSEGMGANLQSVGRHLEGDDPFSRAVNEVQSTAVPTYPPGPHCNAKDLTALGEYLIRRLIDRGMLIETDHVGAHAKNRIIRIAKQCGHPVVSSHFHAGGTTSAEQFERIYATGGLAAPLNPLPEEVPDIVEMLEKRAGDHPYFAVPMSSDTGGLASLPGPSKTEISYPFTSWDGAITFSRQRTGERVFDLNTEGVAHHGLYADWLEAVSRQPGGKEALDTMFRSAEAYLQMWERAAASDCTSAAAPDDGRPLPATGAALPWLLGLAATLGAARGLRLSS